MGAPDFWNDSESAQKVVMQLKGLKAIVGPMNELVESAGDL